MKKNIKYILLGIGIIIGIEIIIGIIGAIVEEHSYSSPKSSEFDKYYYKNRDKVDLEMNKNVEYEDYLLEDGNLLVKVTNNNDYSARATIYVEFLDQENKTLTILDEHIGHISGGRDYYERVRVNEELQKQYKSYEVKVVLEYDALSESYDDGIKLVSFDEKSGIIKFKNNTNKKIDSVYWGILYYDENNKIIDYSYVYSNSVKAHKTVTEKVYYTNKTYNKIKVVFLDAYRY